MKAPRKCVILTDRQWRRVLDLLGEQAENAQHWRDYGGCHMDDDDRLPHQQDIDDVDKLSRLISTQVHR